MHRTRKGSASKMWPCCFGLILLGCWAQASPEPITQFKVETIAAGIVRIAFEDLCGAGLEDRAWDSAEIGMSHRGQGIPIWVEDGGDGRFERGDWIEFRAEILPGTLGYYHEYAPCNVTLLDMTSPAPRRMVPGSLDPESPIAARPPAQSARFRGVLHREVDTLLMRFESTDHRPHEIWYWQQLACTDKEPFRDSFALPDLDSDGNDTVDLEISVRGWSTWAGPASQLPDHTLAVWVNGRPIHLAHWDGKQPHVISIPALPAKLFRREENILALDVRRRTDPADDRVIVDVCVLNGYTVSYPQKNVVPHSGQIRFTPALVPTHSGHWGFWSDVSHLIFYGDSGSRIQTRGGKGLPVGEPPFFWRVPVNAEETGLTAVSSGAWLRPVRIKPYRPGTLRATKQQADYLMIVHPTLIEAIQPLVSFHRDRGLNVRVVDVTEIYDAFNFGIFHPKAIRDFVRFAYARWAPPAPRFVLLVGDASWDTKNAMAQNDLYSAHDHLLGLTTRMSVLPGTPYSESRQNDRNLIPTWDFFSSTGHAASDNAFVCVDGDDFKPDLAIGRIPVTTPQEVGDVVAKTIAYVNTPNVGPWRRNILWITNEQPWAQTRVERLAWECAERGFSATKIFPSSKNQSNIEDTLRIKEALNLGQYLVYFYGHGGRFIWRTGPPDPLKNHDLFTLDDLDGLQPNPRLPILLSFTCYSAPFDHPRADSIGERFLRLPDKGAVAVIAASWRNNPSESMNRLFLEGMMRSGTVGEAMMEAKRQLASRDLVETYNLLGDPAISLDPPKHNVTLRLNEFRPGQTSSLKGKIHMRGFSGRVRVEAIASDLSGLWFTEFETDHSKFQVSVPSNLEGLCRLMCYVWNPEDDRDGVGILDVSPGGPNTIDRERGLDDD